jgi:hypothetical protein
MAHLAMLPTITLDGDRASAIGYLVITVLDAPPDRTSGQGQFARDWRVSDHCEPPGARSYRGWMAGHAPNRSVACRRGCSADPC